MIIEIRDILDAKSTITHARLPRGMTLGQVFESDSRLRQAAPYVVQVKINGARIDDWKDAPLSDGDRIGIDIAPKEVFGIPLFTLLSVAISAISVVQFAVSLFNRPKPTKLDAPKDSPSYSFDGIKTSFSPGGPVPVIYGEHLTGGQLLSMSVDAKHGQGAIEQQQLNMLIGLGVGPITDVSCIRLNNIPIESFEQDNSIVCQAAADQYWIDRPDVAADPYYGSSPQAAYEHWQNLGQFEGSIWHGEFCGNVSWDFRLGTSSQSIIPGFEEVRNTFADGREVSSTAITYVTQGDNIDAVDLQVAAMQGLGIFYGGSHPRLGPQTVRYSIEYKRRDTSSNSWEVFNAAHGFTGTSRGQVWDAPHLNLAQRHSNSRSAWDVRLQWISVAEVEKVSRGDQSLQRIWLRNITEISRERSESYSGTALLAVKAVATNQLQGGAPTVTAMVRGRPVRAYSNETTFVTTWTRNPAWCLLDYMTNSTYGMGAFITTSQINLQSFIDFSTICNTLVSDGAGSMEPQHLFDLVMDKKKPHWSWVQEILGLYRSAMIYSQGKFKIITDRGDRPVRQIFHAGNIVPGTFKLTIGATDPIRPNQATVTFPNRRTDYNLDTIFVQNSASVLGANEPIKEFDLSLIGVTRESEAVREANWQLTRRRQAIREASFSTGLEALAVEPGDMCKTGIVTTDFELGYGGRLLEGSLFHLVLDREVEVKSGYPYELYLWHIGADSMETRTLATTPGSGFSSFKTIIVTPTNPFNITPNVNDRWAIGISSEDLMLGWVKRISRDAEGRHELTVEQFIPTQPVTPTLVSTGWWGVVDFNDPPPQPISVAGSVSFVTAIDGTILGLTTIDAVPAPMQEGGLLTVPSTLESVTLGGSHCPNNDALNQDFFRFVSSGAAAKILAYFGVINKWNGTTRVATLSPAIGLAANSGTAYTIIHRGGNFDGFDLYKRSGADSAYSFVNAILGTHYEHTSDIQSASAVYKIVPFNSAGARNRIGCWEIAIAPQGTFTAPGTPSGLAGVSGGKGVTLTWNANTEADLREYTVHRHTANAFGASSRVAAVRTTNFLDTPTESTTYFYWVRATNTVSLSSPIHPGSTNGVPVFAKAVSQFAEFTNANCMAITTTSFFVMVATVGFVSVGGNITVDGAAFVSALTNIGSNLTQFRLQWLDATSWRTLSTETPKSVDFPPFYGTPSATTAGSSNLQMHFRMEVRDVVGAGDFYAENRQLKIFEVIE